MYDSDTLPNLLAEDADARVELEFNRSRWRDIARISSELFRRKRNLKRRDVVWIESGLNPVKAQETIDHEACTDQKHECYRNLRHDENGSQSLARGPGRAS